YLKTRGFFAMIIPKKYGGLEFSAYAHSCVLAKISSRSATTSSTVAVPNSLGPAELLNHYGTEEQKSYYLPRLARGEEVPCFALTGPRAGSDASSIPDTGVVCRGTWQGREIIGLKLNFSKRCITLPSNAPGAAKAAVWATGAYARIRSQFNTPVGRFEGVEAVIARMAGLTYIMDAARSVTAGAIDGGEKPSVPSAMLKYHVTEMGRQVANDAMDVHGGKGICLGPRNYLGRSYQVVPVAITVEGANLLTRNLIIFGQGAVRCHP